MLPLSSPLRLVALLGLVFVLSDCDGDSRNRHAARGEDYVSDPDHLFFKNTRSRDYRSETISEGVDAYYHDDLQPPRTYVIIDYWLEDRAELLVEEQKMSGAGARVLRDSLRRLDRSAALEVVEDYLRLTGG